MTGDRGLTRVGGVVVLSGPALRTQLQALLIAIRQRRMSGLTTDTFEALAAELAAAMSANGQSDIQNRAVSHPVEMSPTVPIHQAAARLGVSERQARRWAPALGGRKVAGRWLVDQHALDQHLESRRQ